MSLLLSILHDPVLTHTAAAVIGAVLVLGAWPKLRDIEVFQHALAAYEMLPERLLPFLARLIPLAELSAAALLLPAATRTAGALLAASLLALFAVAIVRNLLAGRTDIDCGCGGQEGVTLSWGLVVRNLLLIAIAGLATLSATDRPTTLFDAGAGVLATLVLLGLYTVANQLLANEPRLKKLRNAP